MSIVCLSCWLRGWSPDRPSGAARPVSQTSEPGQWVVRLVSASSMALSRSVVTTCYHLFRLTKPLLRLESVNWFYPPRGRPSFLAWLSMTYDFGLIETEGFLSCFCLIFALGARLSTYRRGCARGRFALVAVAGEPILGPF